MEQKLRIRRALISVSDKQGITELAQFLADQDVEILSTGGTLKTLQSANIPVRSVSDYTGSPEILDGRVKTLHPKIHGGLLGRRDLEDHQTQMRQHDIEPIDLVVVNLYPFQQTIAKPDCTFEDAIENIDIGGPSMLRSAAKNHSAVTVVTDPSDYPTLQEEMKNNDGAVSVAFRLQLACKVFQKTAAYDQAIAEYLSQATTATDEAQFPEQISKSYALKGQLRYGENPHQAAAWYAALPEDACSLSAARILSGKELSYNNLLDLDAALRMVRDFPYPTVAVLKHNNPCGLAANESLAQAYRNAYDCDPVSAYGSIIGLNRPVDMPTAQMIHDSPFIEAVIAPGYESQTLDLLTQKKTRRFLELPGMNQSANASVWDLRPISGGLLLQQSDYVADNEYEWNVVTEVAPTEQDRQSMLFAYRAVKQVKSNAIVLVQQTATVGIGAGQMNRLESVRIAARNAGERAKGAVLASDAFFPFRDGVDEAAQAGVRFIIQPGGSKRDEEVIQAANEAGIAMVFTGKRHFRH